MTNTDKKQEILTLMSHRGFLYGPSPEIYNPIKGSYEYGPNGKLLKNHLEQYLRRKFRRNQFWEVQCPLISPEIVWKASGHVDRFFDYIIQCENPKCNVLHRADTLLEDRGHDLTGVSSDQFETLIHENNLECPACETELTGKVVEQNLMITSNIGFPTSEYILRPETATTTYLLFPNLFREFRTKMPISIFQMGHAFRNEISPRKMLLRTREFEQCEGQIFIFPDQEMDFEPYEETKTETLRLWSSDAQINQEPEPKDMTLEEAIQSGVLQKPAYSWLLYLGYEMVKGLGIPEEKMRLRQHKPDEKAHYAHDAWDLEVESLNYGWTEVCGIHDRGDYDLGRHFEFSKKNALEVHNPTSKEKEIPHILEIAFGVGRLFYMALELGFRFEEDRHLLELPIYLTPIPFAVFPLMKKPELKKIAKKIYEDLIDHDIDAIYQESGSIGKRYRRTEEIGVKFAYTVDYDTLEDNTVTIRLSGDMTQKRIKIENLVDISRKILQGDLSYGEIEDATGTD